MGDLRSCDGRCHQAKKEQCSCWCGGVFHGARGQEARDAFRETFNAAPPADEVEADQMQLPAGGGAPIAAVTWARAWSAARAARSSS